MHKTVAFQSQGCKLNQYEIQAMREGFLQQGFVEVPFSQSADYYILNTCTVTSGADRAARGSINACRRQNANAQIVVTGCYATAEPRLGNLAGVQVVRNASKNQILHQITNAPETSEEESPFFERGIRYFEKHTRAFVKVQDGCNYFCTFCKIPFVRGRLKSRPVQAVVGEVMRLVQSGYEEIVLSGVCLGSYGKDGTGESLLALLKQLLELKGRFRIRLSSIDPRDTPLELAKLMRASDNLCAHLHLSLQSGDDKVLKRMRRGYTCAEFKALVCEIRALAPGIGFSTDVIVGFPGEDEDTFKATTHFLKEIDFHRVHVFPYSARVQTKAYKYTNALAKAVIRTQARELQLQLAPVTARCLETSIGQIHEVLVESKTEQDLVHQGFLGNYMRCAFEATPQDVGRLRKVHVTHSDGVMLKGVLMS